MKRSASGERLYRDMRIRVVIPGQKDIVWRSKAAARKGYSEANLDVMLDQVADHLEKRFPSIEFRVVELAPNMVNFIYEGRKESMEVKSKTPCPELAQSATVATEVCAKQGHLLGVFHDGMEVGPSGPMPRAIKFCQRCGFGLSEVRGDMDLVFNQAVRAEVARIVGPANAKPATAGAGPFPIRPDSVSPTKEPEIPQTADMV